MQPKFDNAAFDEWFLKRLEEKHSARLESGTGQPADKRPQKPKAKRPGRREKARAGK